MKFYTERTHRCTYHTRKCDIMDGRTNRLKLLINPLELADVTQRNRNWRCIIRHYIWQEPSRCVVVEWVWNLMAHGDARKGKWRGNWRMEWVASILTLPRNVVYPALLTLMRTIRLPAVDWTEFKWTRPFRRKTKCDFCTCAIRFQTHYTN